MTIYETERVLQLTADGGGVEVIRHWNEHRAWRFVCRNAGRSPDSSVLNHGRIPQDPEHPHDFLTLGDAIHALSPDDQWISWTVLEVHPDYGQQVWQLREQIIETTDADHRRIARTQDSQWAEACGQRLPKRRSEKTGQLSETVISPGSTLDLVLGASIAVIEHLRKMPMSAEEITEFETKLVHVLQKRKTDRLTHS